MKFISKNTKFTFLPGAVVITLECSYKAMEAMQELVGDVFEVSIEKLRNKRSLNQNALLWKLVGEIDKTINGRRTAEDDQTIYCQILEMASVKSTVVQCFPEAEDMVKSQFRAARVIQRDKNGVMLEVFEGTSQMNTKEMTEVIEQALRYASEVGIDTDVWKEEIYGSYAGAKG